MVGPASKHDGYSFESDPICLECATSSYSKCCTTRDGTFMSMNAVREGRTLNIHNPTNKLANQQATVNTKVLQQLKIPYETDRYIL